ncbi:MAG: VWA domain-containing protein [Rhodospirillaceae bacterium]|nr:VWA domain-containing protein [Rhodospirillaceae bacterium]
MLILDSSASMIEAVTDGPKVAVARQSVADLMKGWNPDNKIGLMAYGHRRADDCSDIETLLPVGPTDPAAIIQAVSRLTPRGTTPLAAAVSLAAEEMNFTKDKATIVLVSDGEETCGIDPCEVARGLREFGLDTTVHVIGFDLDPKAHSGLKCLADETGGLFLIAGNAGELTAALTTVGSIDGSVNAAALLVEAPLEDDAGKPVEVDLSPTALDDPADGLGAVRFSTFMGPGGREVVGACYRVYEMAAINDGAEKEVAATCDATPVVELPPGSYRTQAWFGQSSVSDDIEISAGTTLDQAFFLNAGNFRPRAYAVEGGEPMAKVCYRIFKKTDEGGNREIVASCKPAPTFVLAQGAYRVLAWSGRATSTLDVDVVTGETLEASFILNAGYLALKAVLGENEEPLDGICFKVFDVRPLASGKLREVVASCSPTPTFILPAGAYLVRAEGGKSPQDSEIKIEPGEAKEMAFELAP